MTQKNGHGHAIVCTKEKMTFEEFKKMWKDTTGVNPNDLQSAKNVKVYCNWEGRAGIRLRKYR